MKVIFAENSWPEMKEAIKQKDIVVLVAAATEQHGLHLPVETDTRCAFEVAKRAAEKEGGVLVAPAIPFGLSSMHYEWPGTISIRPSTLIDLVFDVGRHLIHQGFRKIVIVNGHTPNVYCLIIAAGLLKQQTGAFVAVLNWFDLAKDAASQVRESEPGGMRHSCELETSAMLVIRPELVDMSKAVKEMPRLPQDDFVKFDIAIPGKFEISVTPTYTGLTKSGVRGDATVASREKGEKIIEAAVDNLAEFLNALKKWENW